MAFDKVNLASSSPRRKELLSKILNNFNILKPNFTEPEERHYNNPEKYMQSCVSAKVEQIIESEISRHLNELVLVADTTVFLKGRLLGKPKTALEAKEMLKALSGKVHQVYTGYWLGPLQREGFEVSQVQWDISEVRFRPLSSALIQKYVKSKEPMDKAGAYGFQGQGLELIESVKGSYSNIMGLPLMAIQRELKKWSLL